MSMPFVDLKAQFNRLESDIRAAMDRVLAHGRFILGPEVNELEEKLADFAGVKHAVTCSSGTDALLLPLMAYGAGPGDAIFTTPFTFIATAEVISLAGATPVFVDIDPRTFNIDPQKLADAVAETERAGKLRPSGIITVDLFGLPADYDPITKLAAEHGLFVLEDAAQSFGSVYKGKRVGQRGDVAATSFFPAKPLGCYGDGGAVFTDDTEMAEKLRSIRMHGQGANQYDNVRIGLNGRMDTIQAAILLVKLAVFPDELIARERNARKYTGLLEEVVTTPHVPENFQSAWAQYSILTDQRERIIESLKEEGIPAAIYYPKPLHLQEAFAGLGYKPGNFPVSEDVSGKILSLPMHPYLSPEDIEKIAGAVIRALKQP